MAMASSANYGDSQFNLATQGHRQPGSTFKVMALMAAVAQGRRHQHDELRLQAAEHHRPDRTGRSTSRTPTAPPPAGRSDLRRRSLTSDNTVCMQLALDIGPANVTKTAVDMGITSQAERLPGRVARRPRDGRLAARDGQRLRDDHQRRLAHQADRRSPRSCFPDGKIDKTMGKVRKRQDLHRRRGLRGHPGDEGQHQRAAPAPRAASAAATARARPARPTASRTPGSTA